MGMEERDWFRESYAKKNGGRYDRRSGRYWWGGRKPPPAARDLSYESHMPRAMRKTPTPWHPVLVWLLFAAICLGVFVALKLISKIA
jgi:hypothetical protein